MNAFNRPTKATCPDGATVETTWDKPDIVMAKYQHDAAGNRVSDGRHRYAWDAENRLVKIAYKNSPQRATEFQYDGQGRRVAIIETDGAAKTETRYTWCGNVVCAARDGQGRAVAYYFREGVYRPGAKGGKREYYARDHLGSIRDVLDEKGQLVARYDYDPYGNLASDPAKPPEFGFAGMFYHAPSGLYLTKYRAYDPQSGRWLSRDPIGEAGGINLYAYVGGNPVNFVDPLGLQALPLPIPIPPIPGRNTPGRRPVSDPFYGAANDPIFGDGGGGGGGPDCERLKRALDNQYSNICQMRRTSGIFWNATVTNIFEKTYRDGVQAYEANCGPYEPPFPPEPDPETIHDIYGR